jgi:putative membrane protein
MMYWDSSWAWLWMTMMMVIFWGAIAFVVVAVVRRPNSNTTRGSDARDILAERFARGEIDADDYEQRREILDRAAQPTGPRR